MLGDVLAANPAALPTYTALLPDSCIYLVKWMAKLTMRFTSILSGWTTPTKYVHLMWNRFKMVNIHATRATAQVVQFHPSGHRAVNLFPRIDVGFMPLVVHHDAAVGNPVSTINAAIRAGAGTLQESFIRRRIKKTVVVDSRAGSGAKATEPTSDIGWLGKERRGAFLANSGDSDSMNTHRRVPPVVSGSGQLSLRPTLNFSISPLFKGGR